MKTNRLEAFSDGVLAIIITIMVLELKAPHEPTFSALIPLIPVILSYVLSFIYVGIYWNNHHHLFQATETISGSGLWANLHLLFWLSLIPFVTAWTGENEFASLPVALYGFVLMMAGIAYFILSRVLLKHEGDDSALARAIGKDYKGIVSIVIYAIAVAVAFPLPKIAFAMYVAVAVIWFVPDRRIEKQIAE
jgi:uncharacterized membrane protein